MTRTIRRTMMQAHLFTLSLILATAFGFLRPSPWNCDALTKPCNKQTFARPSKAFGSLYSSHASSASSCDLPSAYPPGTPAGLRGEAVRSALRSGQCLGWNLQATPLEFGVVHLSGSGCLDFCNNKLTQSFENKDSTNTFKEACLLTPKGRVIDRLGVAVEHAESAYLITSPGHTSAALYQRLDPYIFPLDQVVLQDCSANADTFVFTLASTQASHVQSAFGTCMLPSLSQASSTQLPQPGSCAVIPLATTDDTKDSSDTTSRLLILPTCAGMPSCAAVTYTFVFLHDTHRLGVRLWESMISEQNMQGPVEIGAAEWESLRIESGLPGFAKEFTGHLKDAPLTPATPLELFLQADTLNLEKGCYLGQEGVASVLKNPRGPPRLLYQVVFEDDFNLYDDEYQQQSGNDDHLENLTRLPAVGDTLYVLGSNQEIAVGSLTSAAEPGSTGEPVTLGLVLARRADSILKAMQARDLRLERSTFMDNNNDDNDGSGMIAPLPLDPLDGLEVIVGDSFTVGQLRMIPSRRLPRGATLFDTDGVSVFATQTAEARELELRRVDATSMNDEITWADVAAATATDWDAVQVVVDKDTLVRDDETAIDSDEDDEKALQLAMEEAAKAQSEADAAADEAKRKAEKMELLRQKAEEAMARRKQKKK